MSESLEKSKLCNICDKYTIYSLEDALREACRKGHVECTKFLCEFKTIKINKQSRSGYTALMVASLNGHHQCVEILCEHGADLECTTSVNETAIILASQRGSLECVKILHGYGANIHHVNSYNESALTTRAVVPYNNDECIMYLSEHDNLSLGPKFAGFVSEI